MEIKGLKEVFRGEGGGSGSAGLQAARNLTPTSKSRGTSDDDEGVGMEDDTPSGNRQYGNVETSSWGFEGLDNNADHDAEMLLGNLEDADADSNAAEHDFDDREDDFGDLQTPRSSWNDHDEEGITFGGPSDDYEDDEDDHGLYSSHVRHVEDTSMTHGDDDQDDPPAVDITLSSDDSHAKMD